MNLTDLSSTQRKSRIAELMGQTGLQKSLLDTPVRKLSGGETTAACFVALPIYLPRVFDFR